MPELKTKPFTGTKLEVKQGGGSQEKEKRKEKDKKNTMETVIDKLESLNKTKSKMMVFSLLH